MKTISRDVAFAEITLRKYEKAENFSGRELVRKLVLSLGLLQPGDSRDVIVDVLWVILKGEKGIDDVIKQVAAERKKSRLPILGVAGSNIRRQLRRLKDMLIIEKKNNVYRISENASFSEIVEKINKIYVQPTLERTMEYAARIDELKANI